MSDNLPGVIAVAVIVGCITYCSTQRDKIDFEKWKIQDERSYQEKERPLGHEAKP